MTVITFCSFEKNTVEGLDIRDDRTSEPMLNKKKWVTLSKRRNNFNKNQIVIRSQDPCSQIKQL